MSKNEWGGSTGYKKTPFIVQGGTPYLKLSDISGRGNLRFNQAPNNSINSLHSPTKSPCSPICPPEMINSRWEITSLRKWSTWIIFKTGLIKGHFNLLGLSVRRWAVVNFHTATPADYRHGFLIGSLVIMIVTRVIITIIILDIVSVFISRRLKFSWSIWRVELFITELVTKENTRYFAN